MKNSNSLLACLLALLVLSTVGCGQTRTRWEPMLEETSSNSLRVEVERATSAVEAARALLDTDPQAAELSLKEAEQALKHLQEFFLPLHQAREHAYNAYRYFVLGEIARAEAELNHAEALLEAIAESRDGQRLREMEPPLEILEDARTALKIDDKEAAELLQILANHLNNMVIKGGLVIHQEPL
jgi:tetratricopeptide (TPR) repeat protein